MAALTGERMTRFQTIKTKMFPLKAGATAYKGGMVLADPANAYVLPGTSGTSTLLAVGVFESDNNNSAGTVTSFVNVTLSKEILCWMWDSVTGVNAVTAANLFANVYVVDDHTVTTSSAGSAPIAGRVWGIDPITGQVLVQQNQF